MNHCIDHIRFCLYVLKHNYMDKNNSRDMTNYHEIRFIDFVFIFVILLVHKRIYVTKVEYSPTIRFCVFPKSKIRSGGMCIHMYGGSI